MTGWLLAQIGYGLTTVLAYGGLAAAPALILARFAFPNLPRWLVGALSTGGSIAAIIVSTWNFSALHHDRQVEVDRLQAVVAEQARQREVAERIAKQAQDQARHRAADVADLQETIDDYESALAAGTASTCPDDPDYASRMRRIRIGPAGNAGSVTSRN